MAAINVILVDMATFFSVGRSMNAQQLKETTRLIAKDFYFLKIEDLKLFSDKMKSGAYGKIFDRLDGNVILTALADYAEQRICKAEEINQEKHKALKESENDKVYLLKVGDNYVRECGDVFEEVDKRELATAFTFGVAFKLKEWLIKDYYQLNPSYVRFSHKNMPDQKFFDELEHKRTELLSKEAKFKRANNEYHEMKKKILNDHGLTNFEKENAIRRLAGLPELNNEEYNLQQQVLNNSNP